VSVRQSNKILRLIVASSWLFYLSNSCSAGQDIPHLYETPSSSN
jgi:hypothetical protein